MISKVLLYISTLAMLLSCSFFRKDRSNEYKEELKKIDYLSHYQTLGSIYLNSEGNESIPLSEKSLKYIQDVYERIATNNQLIFHEPSKINFYIIKSETPFLFSLPGKQFFFSSGLFSKHLKSENLFYATFVSELIKNEKEIYEKKFVYPLGFITTEKMIDLTRVKLEYKKRINEWGYIALKRAGLDASSYLNWIQVQNRNSLDFSMYLGDSLGISSEEQALKNFMTKQGISGLEKKIYEANSSKEYYEFMKEILKGKDETRTIRKNTSRRTI